jgi:hypothetical protein
MKFLTLTQIRGGYSVREFELFHMVQPAGSAEIYGNYHLVPQRLRS